MLSTDNIIQNFVVLEPKKFLGVSIHWSKYNHNSWKASLTSLAVGHFVKKSKVNVKVCFLGVASYCRGRKVKVNASNGS